MSSGIQVVYGAAAAGYGPPEAQARFSETLAVLKKHGIITLDTAQAYPNSEATLGKHGVPSQFTVDTKWRGGLKPAEEPKEDVLVCIRDSLKSLATGSVDVYYVHLPPSDQEMEEYLPGIDEAYRAGLFKRFGLSNFRADEVQKLYDYCRAKGFVLPTVYQGNYNPVARKQETVLFPTLRKLGMAFYAYSPLAGGFLTKTKQQVQEGAGRFDTSTGLGKMYSGLYARPSYMEALKEWESIAEEAGCSRADLAYRWVRYHSPLEKKHGDAIIVGARTREQLEQTLTGLEVGPLPKRAVERIDGIWEAIKHEAGVDNFNQ